MRWRIHEGTRVLLASIASLVLLGGSTARAQGPGSWARGMGPGTMPSYNFSRAGMTSSESSTYLPFGGTMSGFVPYNPGPGGGLGVQTPMANTPMQTPPGGMKMPGARPNLGGRITPLRPIGSMGSPRGGAMGNLGTMIQRAPAGGSMGGMTRPPVGGYPFRQPPALTGPSSAPAMSM